QENLESEAQEACNIALQYYPFAIGINLFKAELLFHSQKYRQANVILDELEQLNPSNLDIVLLKSEVLVAQLKYKDAAAYLKDKSEIFDGQQKIDILLELTDIYEELEEHEMIYNTLEYILKLDKRNEEALNKISFWS